MKAKTLMGMIACAGACVSLSAFGNTNADWFSASASGTTPSLSGVAASGTYTVADDEGHVSQRGRTVTVEPNTSYEAAGLPICMYHSGRRTGDCGGFVLPCAGRHLTLLRFIV